jgi:biopolymer transport protein ExbD
MAQAVSSSLSLGGARDVPPMSEINTTPLIDVMLVLLIMFIITVPMQTHEVPLKLPKGGDAAPIRLKNDLVMDAAGRLAWNGSAVSDAQLAGLMAEVASRAEQPEVHFRPDAAARYARVDQVLAIASKSGASSFGFVGNEQYKKVF